MRTVGTTANESNTKDVASALQRIVTLGTVSIADIAVVARTGVLSMECNCESIKCAHGDSACKHDAVTTLETIYGKYHMCAECARNMPAEFLKDSDTQRESDESQ